MNNGQAFNQKSRSLNKTSKKLKNWDKVSKKHERDGQRRDRGNHTKKSSHPSSFQEKEMPGFNCYETLPHLKKEFDQSHFTTMQMSSYASSLTDKNLKRDQIPDILKSSLQNQFRKLTAEDMLESNYVNYLHLFEEQLRNTDNKYSIQAVKEEKERSIKVIMNSLTNYSEFEELENAVNATINKFDFNS